VKDAKENEVQALYQVHQSGDCIPIRLGIDFLGVLGVLRGETLFLD
jgi:hypothetical protein